VGLWYRADEYARRATSFVREAKELDHRFVTLDQFLIKPRTVAVVEHLAREVQRIELRRPALRSLPADQERRERGQLVFPLAICIRDLRRLLDIKLRRQRLWGNVAKIFLDKLLHGRVVEVARDREYGVVRRVIDAEKFLHILN